MSRRAYHRARYLAKRNDPGWIAHQYQLARAWNKRYPEHNAFYNARRRCTEVTNREYARYGGRGIKFLFKSFPEFLAHIGRRPDGYTLDRINNDGHYEPGNVRWATPSEQAYNRRKS